MGRFPVGLVRLPHHGSLISRSARPREAPRDQATAPHCSFSRVMRRSAMASRCFSLHFRRREPASAAGDMKLVILLFHQGNLCKHVGCAGHAFAAAQHGTIVGNLAFSAAHGRMRTKSFECSRSMIHGFDLISGHTSARGSAPALHAPG